MWYITEQPATAADTWHKTYSVACSEVLGRMGCVVTSKILGIGTAERNWKQIKAVKTGQRTNLGPEKCKQQALIYGRYQQQRAHIKYARLSAAFYWAQDGWLVWRDYLIVGGTTQKQSW